MRQGWVGVFFPLFLWVSLFGKTKKKLLPPAAEKSIFEKRLEALEQWKKKQENLLLPSWLGIALGGQYRVMANGSNSSWHAKTLSCDQRSENFVNQRFRTWLNFYEKQEKRLGVYFQLEIGHNLWGDDREAPKTHTANGQEVGLELRRGFLWWRLGKHHLFRTGVQAWHDRFGEPPKFQKDWLFSVDHYDSFQAVLANSIWDFNVAGLSVEGSFASYYHYRAGWFLLGSGRRTFTGGNGSTNLFTADLDIELGRHLIGGSIYYLWDRGDYSYGTFGGPKTNYEKSWNIWVGLRGHFWIQKSLHFSFFIIHNHGEVFQKGWLLYLHRGFALKTALVFQKSFLGTFAFQFLFSTGGKGKKLDSFRTIAQSERDDLGSQGYWSFLSLTSPWGASDVKDLGISLQNQGLGLFALQLAWQRKIFPFLEVYCAAGWFRSDSPHPAGQRRNMGWEFFTELRWNLYKWLSLNTGFSYFITEGFFKATKWSKNPDDLWEVAMRLQIEF